MDSTAKPLVIPIFIPHAGCPHRCVFCNQAAITGTKKPAATTDIQATVHRFLSYNRRRRSPVQIAFFGGNFLGLAPETVTALLDEAESCVRAGLADSIRFSTRPDTISPETLNLISGYSVRTIELGIQSMDDAVLSLSRRGHSARQSADALRLLKTCGYESGAQIMTGLPGDTGPQSVRTVEVLATLAPDFVRIYPAIVIAGSVLAEWYRNGTYRPATVEEAVTLVASLFQTFEARHIPVIRMGLQPTEDLNDSATVLAGPYHPAFGHLVLSRLSFERAVAAIISREGHSDALTLTVHPRDVSALRGLRNDNIRRLKEQLGISAIHVVENDSLPIGRVVCD